MRPRIAPVASRPKERFQTTSRGVLTDAKKVKRATLARKKGCTKAIAKRLFRNIRLSKQKRKNIRSAMLFFVMLVAFSLFSVFFADRVLPPEDPPAISTAEYVAASTSTRAPETVREEKSVISNARTNAPAGVTVFYSASGSRYHLTATCSGMKEAKETDLSLAKAQGLTPCKRCNPPE